jgi:hypothetical protein
VEDIYSCTFTHSIDDYQATLIKLRQDVIIRRIT